MIDWKKRLDKKSKKKKLNLYFLIICMFIVKVKFFQMEFFRLLFTILQVLSIHTIAKLDEQCEYVARIASFPKLSCGPAQGAGPRSARTPRHALISKLIIDLDSWAMSYYCDLLSEIWLDLRKVRPGGGAFLTLTLS